jgi:hypothetical protein
MAPQETKFNTSFIPKKPVATSSGVSSKTTSSFRKRGPNILSLIGLFIFLASLVSTAGVYGWKYQTEKSIADQIESLKIAREGFDEQTVANATRLNERIISVKSILENHTAPSNVFAVIEDVILKSVRLKNFSYSLQANGGVKLSGSGTASGYEAVVLQSDEFGYTGKFRDVIFSNVQNNQDSTVNFNFSAVVDSDMFLYSKNMEAGLTYNVEMKTLNDDAENAANISEVNNIFKR